MIKVTRDAELDMEGDVSKSYINTKRLCNSYPLMNFSYKSRNEFVFVRAQNGVIGSFVHRTRLAQHSTVPVLW